MTNFPIMGQTVFKESGAPGEYAHIAWGDIETQFYGYIAGYKEAADTIVQRALRRGDNRTLDTFIFPACFLYRQYLELTLKDIYLANSPDSTETKKRTLKRCQHNLKKIWIKVKKLIISDFPNEGRSDLEAAESYIFQFSDEDKNSFAFRYPITKDLDLINNKKFINLKNLAERMSELESFLSAVSMGMSVHRDFENEMKSYYDVDSEEYY